ncbi:MAG: hypothetical protein KF716_16185 [Anaerolineae bacterium]|nr:hypothetical protein [Anaerolineae bacterium]
MSNLISSPKGEPAKKSAQHLKNILKATKLNFVINKAMNFMPSPIQRWAVSMGARRELVPIDRLTTCYSTALQTLQGTRGTAAFGDYLEFGVYQGSSMSCFYAASLALKLKHLRMFGFDSFEGMPPQALGEDENVWRPGEFHSSLDYTTAYLIHKGVDMDRAILIKGWFEDTCNETTVLRYSIAKASIIMIDCDLYSSAKVALAFCQPFIKDEVIIFFDDWHSYQLADKNLGERKAFDEFLQANRHLEAEEHVELSYGETSTAFRVRVR